MALNQVESLKEITMAAIMRALKVTTIVTRVSSPRDDMGAGDLGVDEVKNPTTN